MARTEARISVDIWEDGAYRELSPMAQWAYEFLLSQRDLAHDGVIGLRVRRWSRHARGLTEEQLADALGELEQARFVVVDRDTEELLIRSLIRRDKIYRQPNVLRAAADHLPLVLSGVLRHALAVELARIAAEPMPDGSHAILAEMRAELPDLAPVDQPGTDETAADEGPPNPSRNPSRKGSGYPSAGTPGVRGMVTVVSNGFPVPRSPEAPDPRPQGAPPARPSRAHVREGGPRPTIEAGSDQTADERAHAGESQRHRPGKSPDASSAEPPGKTSRQPKRGTRIPDDFAPTPDMIKWAREHTPLASPSDNEAFVDYWRGVTTTKLDWPATWRNWMRRANADERARNARATPRANGLVERDGLQLKPETAANLDRTQRFAAIDAQRAIEGGPT